MRVLAAACSRVQCTGPCEHACPGRRVQARAALAATAAAPAHRRLKSPLAPPTTPCSPPALRTCHCTPATAPLSLCPSPPSPRRTIAPAHPTTGIHRGAGAPAGLLPLLHARCARLARCGAAARPGQWFCHVWVLQQSGQDYAHGARAHAWLGCVHTARLWSSAVCTRHGRGSAVCTRAAVELSCLPPCVHTLRQCCCTRVGQRVQLTAACAPVGATAQGSPAWPIRALRPFPSAAPTVARMRACMCIRRC